MLSGSDYLQQLRSDRIQREGAARITQRQVGTFQGFDAQGRLRVRLIDTSILYVRSRDAITNGSIAIGATVNVVQNGSQFFLDAPQRKAY